MRVLHIFDHSLPLQSGYAFRSREILREQHLLGMETLHVTSGKHKSSGEIEEVDGLHFHRTAPGLLGSIPVLDQWDVVRGLESRLRTVLSTGPIDIMHAHSPCLTGLAALGANRPFKRPFVYEMRAVWEDAAVDHGTARPSGLRYRLQRALETHVLRRADAIVCICEGLKSEIVQRGIPAERVTVVPNGVDLDRFTPILHRDEGLARELHLGRGPIIGFIGSLYRYEGVDLALQALALLRDSHPSLAMIIVGTGPEEGCLKALIRASGLQGRALAVGGVSHSQIAHFYSLMDLLIYPRRSTRLTELVTPLKPLEAMAQAKPVVASDIGGHREMIRHGETGVLFPPGSAQAIAVAISMAIQTRTLWPSLAASARAYVERERSWRGSVRRYLSIYAAAEQRLRTRVGG
jgi:PEP-CTERM/exosortase A-associated glycosyltransferase